MPRSSEAGLAVFQHAGLRAWPPQRRTYPSTVEKVLGPKDDPTYQHFGVEDMSAAKNTWGRTHTLQRHLVQRGTRAGSWQAGRYL